MAQYKFLAKLTSASFPLNKDFQTRTVLVGRLDQNPGSASNTDQSRTVLEKEDNQPEVLYMENVLPTVYGYKSVSFDIISNDFTGLVGNEEFKDVISLRSTTRSALLGITTTGRALLFSGAGFSSWKDITPVATPNRDITTAFVQGVLYICYANYDIYTVNLVTEAMLSVTLTGIASNTIVGITQASSYLLLHNGTTVFWSSPTTPTDFVPSLITGAGSGIPLGLKGTIIRLQEIQNGYAVYSTTNIVIAVYSGNTRYPWIFSEAANSSGIKNIYSVSIGGDDGTNYAWTAAGLLKVAIRGCEPYLPEVTDFLTSRILEDFNYNTEVFTTSFINEDLRVAILFSSSRYLAISYGRSRYEYCLLYDIALKRMGKLKLAHVGLVEFSLAADRDFATFNDLSGVTFNALANITFDALFAFTGAPANPKKTLAFVTANGSLKLANFDVGNFDSQSVLILGKYQLARERLITLQELEVESLYQANNNFSLKVLPSLDGKNFGAAIVPYKSYDSGLVKQYLTQVTATNYSVLIKGSFNLTALQMAVSVHGRM